MYNSVSQSDAMYNSVGITFPELYKYWIIRSVNSWIRAEHIDALHSLLPNTPIATVVGHLKDDFIFSYIN